MKQKIVIAGGTGYIGRYFEKRFAEDGFEVVIISRKGQHISWNDDTRLIEALGNAVALINLAGKSVDCRYNAKNKALILQSRVETTEKLQTIVDKCIAPPQLWINASTATIYRHSEDRPMDEATGEIGSGFSVEVARAWERAFFQTPRHGVRKIALRIAIALGKDGGVMKPYKNLVKCGLGGRQGSGRQMFSWIHIEDLYQIVRFLMKKKDMEGIYNAASPAPVTNRLFMKALRKVLKPVFYLPSPKWLLEAGARFINTETELILKSRWVIPKRLAESGYKFQYETIEAAVTDILQPESTA